MKDDNNFRRNLGVIKTSTPPEFELVADLSDDPVRFGASDHPGKIVYAKKIDLGFSGYGGNEFVAYWLPIPSWKNHNLMRGVYADLVNFQDRKYLVSGCSERPWPRIGKFANPQFCCCEMFRSFEEAYPCFIGYVQAALDFINPFTWVQPDNMNVERDWSPPKTPTATDWKGAFRSKAIDL